jgi:hypothetical protein
VSAFSRVGGCQHFAFIFRVEVLSSLMLRHMRLKYEQG